MLLNGFDWEFYHASRILKDSYQAFMITFFYAQFPALFLWWTVYLLFKSLFFSNQEIRVYFVEQRQKIEKTVFQVILTDLNRLWTNLCLTKLATNVCFNHQFWLLFLQHPFQSFKSYNFLITLNCNINVCKWRFVVNNAAAGLFHESNQNHVLFKIVALIVDFLTFSTPFFIEGNI